MKRSVKKQRALSMASIFLKKSNHISDEILFPIQVKYYRDTYAEHPEDRENIEYCVQMEGEDALLTLTELYDQMKTLGFDLSYFRFVLTMYFKI